jgi:hypothetical protein
MIIDGNIVNSRNGVIEFQPELNKKLMLLKYFFNKRTGCSLQISEKEIDGSIFIPRETYHNGRTWEKIKKNLKITIITNNKTEFDLGTSVSDLLSLTKYLSIYTTLDWDRDRLTMTATTITNVCVNSSSKTTPDEKTEIPIPYEIPVGEYYKLISREFDTTSTTLSEAIKQSNSTVVTNRKKSLVTKFYEYITNW